MTTRVLAPGEPVEWMDGSVIRVGEVVGLVGHQPPRTGTPGEDWGPWYRIDCITGGRYVLPVQRLLMRPST